MHGVNLNTLGRRDPSHYGTSSLAELEQKVARWAHELGLEPRFMQTNDERELIEYLQELSDVVDGGILNAGAWTHYSYALRDALEVCGVPIVEVHLSDIHSREPWRRTSVFEGLVIEQISGEGPDGYRRAVERLAAELGVSG
jgi:3-dehydroquinate dehydratase-2